MVGKVYFPKYILFKILSSICFGFLQVIGIEMNASAVSDAHRNAEINGIKNFRFICSKVRSTALIGNHC